MRITEGLVGSWPSRSKPVVVPDAIAHPRFKYFREAGEEPFRTFPGRAADRSRRAAGRAGRADASSRARFTDDEVGMLVDGRRAARADRQRGAHARAVRRAGAAAAVRRWPATCGGAGTPRASTCSATSIRSAGGSSTTTRSRCCARCTPERLESGPREMVLYSRINHAYRRLKEYLQADAHLGRAPRRRAAARGRWPTSRPSSACTSRCRSTPAAWACSRATTSRAPAAWACRWSAIGLFYDQGYFKQHLDDDGWQQRRVSRHRRSRTCRWSRPSAPTASRSRSRSRPAPGRSARQGLADARRPRARCTCSTATSKATARRIAS